MSTARRSSATAPTAAPSPTYELVAPDALATGSTAAPAPAGFEFFGWFRSDGTRLTDNTSFTYVPTIADMGITMWEVGRAYTVYAVYRELDDVTTYYAVKDGKGGTLDKDYEIYPPVSGVPSGPIITTAPGYIFDHWEDKDGNYVLIDGTTIPASMVTDDTQLMTEALRLFKDADGTYYNQDGKTYYAAFRFTKVDVVVEHYRVIEGEIVNAKEDGTLVTGINRPWVIENLKILAEEDIDGTVAVDEAPGNHGSYEPDWPGYTLDLTYGGTIKTAKVSPDGTTVLRLYYVADEFTSFTVHAKLVYEDGTIVDYDDYIHGPAAPDGAVHDDWGGITDTEMSLMVKIGDEWRLLDGSTPETTAVKGHQAPVIVPAGYEWDNTRIDNMRGIVAGDGSLELTVYFKPVHNGTSYSVEYWTVDGMNNLTRVHTDVFDMQTAGDPADAETDQSKLAADVYERLKGYEFTMDTMDVTYEGNHVLVRSVIHTDHIAGDGSTVLRVYYKALPRTLHYVSGPDTVWDDGGTDDSHDLALATGTQTSLLKGGVQRAGYEFKGWSLQNSGQLLTGTASIDEAQRMAEAGLIITDDPWTVITSDDAVINLYAVWSALPTTYDVEVWVVNGDGSLEHYVDYDLVGVTGTTGNTADFTDPTAPFESWGVNADERTMLGEDFVINVPGFVFMKDGYTPTPGQATVGGVTAPAGSVYSTQITATGTKLVLF